MSIDATRWAWQQDVARSTDKLVLLSIADRADEHNRAYPSILRLSKDTGCNRKTVMAAVARLADAGLIHAVKVGGKVTVYELVGVEERHNYQSQKRDRSRNRDQYQKRDCTSPKNGTGPVPKTGHEPINNQPRTNKHSDRKRSRVFVSPTTSDVLAYCREHGYTVDPEAFVNYYESTGWHVGKAKMKDWKAAVRTWEKRNAQNQRSNSSNNRNRAERFFDAIQEYAATGDVDSGTVRETGGEVWPQVVEFIPGRAGKTGNG